MAVPPARFTLRQLPLAAKLVLSVFLIAVGLGYFSAMVQLHLKHSKKEGEPLPSPGDVIEVFAGLKPADPNAPPPCSRIDVLLTGDPTAADVSKDNMAPAFFAKSKGWNANRAARGAKVDDLQLQREGERLAMLAWARLPDGVKKREAYEADAYPLPDALKTQAITPEFLTPDRDVKVRTLIDARCMNCHKEQAPSLATFAEIEPHVTPPSTDLIDGKWVRSSRQISVESLTQSTHAHLLSFAVLFALTGLVFAFSSYPGLVRGIIGPVVLLAQVCDIACWWLARVPTYGPLFAQAIMATGGVVGLGLATQIVFGLLDLYGWKGKAVVLLLLLVGGAGVGYVGLKVIQPALDEERRLTAERAKPAEPKTADTKQPAVAPPGVSHLERLITGPRGKDAPWNGKGSMAEAFYEKDGADYKDTVKKKPHLKAKLDAEREGEQLALKWWINLEPAARKKAYDDDLCPLPPDRAGKPLTEDYAADDGKAAKVKSILTDRCVQCHAAGKDQGDFPLETYEQLMKYMEKK